MVYFVLLKGMERHPLTLGEIKKYASYKKKKKHLKRPNLTCTTILSTLVSYETILTTHL